MIPKPVLLLVCVAVTSGNPAAGKPWHWKSPMPVVTPTGSVKSGRIVGGTEAIPHSWPHQVALFVEHDMFFCGGSIISAEWILTAAHCVDGYSFADAVMGAHNILKPEETQVTMRSKEFTVHEGWDSQKIVNDIALVKLPSPVSFTAAIAAVSLPSSDVAVGDIVSPTGWGYTSDPPGGETAVLMQVDVPIISNTDCSASLGTVGDGVVCTNGTGPHSVCHGDSGGPLNKDGKTYGITSFGNPDTCEGGYPDAFTRVYYYLDWIKNKTGITP